MNRRAALLFLFALGAILYLSLYPPQTGVPPVASKLLWVPLSDHAQRIDFIMNIALYVPLGAAAFVALRSGIRAVFAATLICALISLAVEYAQLSIPSRDGSLNDLAANSFGALLGAVLAFAAERVRAHPSKLLFSGLWFAWQGFMLLPKPRSIVDVNHELVGLLILAMVFTRKISRLAAPLLLVWLAVEELRPFEFQGPAAPFSWIPFEGWFRGSPESYYSTLAGKLFLYTAVVWVMRRSGARMLWAFLAPATILAVGEFTQRYLPGRTAEITDLVLLAGGATLLHLTAANS